MIDETHFNAIANATLIHCFDQLEDAYERGDIEELELESGVLAITTSEGKQFVVSKHAPSRQIWLASPLSGGLHFNYSQTDQRWALPDGSTLYEILRRDLAQCGTEAVL
jgi:frataxin